MGEFTQQFVALEGLGDLNTLLCCRLAHSENLKAFLKLLNDKECNHDGLVERHLLENHLTVFVDDRHSLTRLVWGELFGPCALIPMLDKTFDLCADHFQDTKNETNSQRWDTEEKPDARLDLKVIFFEDFETN